MELDLNADLGEGAGFDDQLMPLITSANVCCGTHAGGPEEIGATLELARRFGVAIGAHPGYPDREHFGRIELDLPSLEITSLILSQLEVMNSAAQANSLAMMYVKPHGALYNQACRDRRVADAIVMAVSRFQLPVVGLPQSQLEAACRGSVPFVAEGFADRRYRADGSLVPRTEHNAFIHDPSEAVQQVEWLMREKGIQTVCIHGDNPEAVRFAAELREALVLKGVTLRKFSS
jgi:UPF0271 protein